MNDPTHMGTPDVPPLTARQWRILGHIASYIETHGYGPSLRDIALMAGLAAQSVALVHVRALESKGMVARTPGVARSIRLVKR